MPVNEKTGLRLTHEGMTYYFCGRHCLERFSKEKNISEEVRIACAPARRIPFYKNKIFTLSLILVFLLTASFFIPLLVPFRKVFLLYFKTVWWAVAAGLFLGGIIDYYIPREYISHLLARPEKRTIFYSVFLGFLLSACSHGILALSIQLHKKGASNPAVAAFLLATPWANMSLTLMLLSFFGLKGLFIIFSAILIGITTGLIFQVFERKGWIETNQNTVQLRKDFSILEDFRNRMKDVKFSKNTFTADIKGILNGTLALANMVLWWILLGMGIASLLGAYIPSHFFHNYMGPSLTGMLVTLFVATVIEVCSEGSAPMAFEIYRQTSSLGNSFVFLMAGVVTDYTEIGLLWQNVGRKTAILFPLVTVPQVLLLGWLANLLF